MRLKDVCYINKSSLSETTPSDYKFNYIDISNVSGDGTVTISDEMTFSEAPSRARRIIKKNDVIISTVRTYLKAISTITEDVFNVIASTGFAVCTPKDCIIPSFLSYSIKADDTIDEICKESTGVSYPAITATTLSSISIPFYDTEKQSRIVSYLDNNLEIINNRIATFDKKVSAYTRLKASIINRAVTKGLNPDVKLKESEIEWVSEIPENWAIRRFKEIFTKYIKGVTPDSKKTDNFATYGGYPWITIADMTSKVVSQGQLNLSDKAILDYNPPLVRKGSLLFSFKLSIGKVSFASNDLYTNEAIISLSPDDTYDLNYIYYLLPRVLIENSTENIYGAKMLNQKIILNMIMPLPPLVEQQAIASYLDNKCAKIDAAIENIEKQIAALKRLKRALINEVVTGKREV